MSESIPVGSRVVLVEDNRLGGRACGKKGARGVVTGELDRDGDYRIQFDNDGKTWWVNASAVALEAPTPTAAPNTLTPWERDTALAMALTLADEVEESLADDWDKRHGMSIGCWLRDCVRRDLEGQ